MVDDIGKRGTILLLGANAGYEQNGECGGDDDCVSHDANGGGLKTDMISLIISSCDANRSRS